MFLILLSSSESHQTNLSCFDEPNNVGLGWLYVLAWVEIIVIECISSLLNSRLKWTSIDKYRYFLFQDVGYYIEYQLGMSDSIFSKQLPAQTWSEKQRPKCGLSAPIQTEFLNENSKIPTLNIISQLYPKMMQISVLLLTVVYLELSPKNHYALTIKSYFIFWFHICHSIPFGSILQFIKPFIALLVRS